MKFLFCTAECVSSYCNMSFTFEFFFRSAYVLTQKLDAFSFPVQKLEELEKEEELRENAGLYDNDEESDDDDMKELRKTARK